MQDSLNNCESFDKKAETIDWDSIYYDLTNRYQCSNYDVRQKPKKKLVARRRKILEIINKTKELYSINPNIKEDDLRKALEMQFIPGLFSTILLSIVSVMVKYVIDYIIDRLYPKNQSFSGDTRSI